MARNKVQFQKGLGMAEFMRAYGRENQCRAALAKWRRLDGFVCPRCGGAQHSYVQTRHLPGPPFRTTSTLARFSS